MTEIEWAEGDKLPSGNEKYPPMLTAIKESSLDGDHRHWGVLESFTSDQTGRDLAYRLKAANPEFEFVSRKAGDEVTVYARLRKEVQA